MRRYRLTSLGYICLAAAATYGCGSDGSTGPAHTQTGPEPKREPAAPELQTPVTSSSLRRISGSSANDIWAVGASGAVLHYDGKKWSSVPAPPFDSTLSSGSSDLLAVWAASEGDAWAVGDSEVVLRWDGSSWQHVLAPANGALIDVWGTSSDDVWAVGVDDGSAFVRHWSGTKWDYNWLDTAPSFWGVWGTGPNDVWIVGTAGPDTGYIFRYDGTKIDQMTFDGPPLRAIAGTGPDDVWVVPQQMPMEHWNGSTWEVPPSPAINGTLFDVWTNTSSDVWACGTMGLLMHWDGSAWTEVPVATTETLEGVWGTAADNVWVVGSKGTILHYDGDTWASAFSQQTDGGSR